MPDVAGRAPATTSTTVRPAETASGGNSVATSQTAGTGANTEGLEPAVVRRSVDAAAAITGCRRKEAREQVNAWRSGGRPLADLEAYLRATFRLDPTGVTAVRNADRLRGGRRAS